MPMRSPRNEVDRCLFEADGKQNVRKKSLTFFFLVFVALSESLQHKCIQCLFNWERQRYPVCHL